MPKVTSKLQLTVPKTIAEEYGIKPGDELQWIPSGEIIRVVPARRSKKGHRELTLTERLAIFDRSTERQRKREKSQSIPASKESANERGWKREDLYRRGLSD